mmetsp:Transcript_56285/g.150446  ORF Transcript_56285/g.150446 Transcript_56285/m.150446 type:complete len:245 (-) Transcript_56285:3488-4222(-)
MSQSAFAETFTSPERVCRPQQRAAVATRESDRSWQHVDCLRRPSSRHPNSALYSATTPSLECIIVIILHCYIVIANTGDACDACDAGNAPQSASERRASTALVGLRQSRLEQRVQGVWRTPSSSRWRTLTLNAETVATASIGVVVGVVVRDRLAVNLGARSPRHPRHPCPRFLWFLALSRLGTCQGFQWRRTCQYTARILSEGAERAALFLRLHPGHELRAKIPKVWHEFSDHLPERFLPKAWI